MTTTTYRDQVLHTGLLFKKGSGNDYPFGRRNWKTHFFVLTPSALKYYKYDGGSWKGEVDLGAKNAKSSELLTTIDVMPVDSKKTGNSASTIWRIAVNTKDRRLLLSATSEIEMNLWVEKLNLAVRISQSSRQELPSHSELQGQDQRHHSRPHHMSLPDNMTMTGASTFIADFPGVNVPRRRVSVGAMAAERASFSGYADDSQQLWDLPRMTTSKSSPELAAQAQESFDNAMRRVLQSESKNSNSALSFGAQDDSGAEADITTMSPQARRQGYYHSGRISLPNSLEAQGYSDAPPPKSIADFHNFTSSRRRMSMDSGKRLQRRLSLDAQSEWRERRSFECEEEEEKQEDEGEKEEEGEACVGVEAQKPLEREDHRRRTFARLREWFSRH